MCRPAVPVRGHIPEASKSILDAVPKQLGVVAENILTNMLNVVAETDIDVPVVRAGDAA